MLVGAAMDHAQQSLRRINSCLKQLPLSCDSHSRMLFIGRLELVDDHEESPRGGQFH